ncbi:hypothetical protein MIR68_009202 [Amoeboaphelidium protococcarum]|nr:hypothetical protein MIR68_009202 [Amoeboaphelidium protococcarum]
MLSSPTQQRHRENDLYLQQRAQETYELAAENRPENTNLAYNPKQIEFQDWCTERQFRDRDTVSGEKLHAFVSDMVVGRPSRTDPTVTVGAPTVNSYVAAITDLYKQQKLRNMNNYPPPRDFPAVKQLLHQVRGAQDQVNRRNYADRIAGTIADGYSSVEELQRIADWFMNSGGRNGLRDRFMFLMAHYCLLRGESLRALELADLYAIKLENEGFTECWALLVLMCQGKTNQFNRKEFGSCLRNKRVEICPFGALALYLFQRWHDFNEPFPDLTSPQDWFQIKVCRARGLTEEMTYQTHYNAVNKCLRACNIQSSAKTHIGRGAGARMAELQGASEGDIRRLGRWNSQAMEGCYLTALPRGAMRSLAGFPTDSGSFYLDRGQIDPPEHLQRLIFPEIDTYVIAELAHTTTAGFIKLLKYMRIVVLQDAAIMQDQYPDQTLFNHALFRSQDFLHYKEQLLAARVNNLPPTELRLQQAMPELVNKIDSVGHSLHGKIDVLNHKVEQYAHSNTQVRNTLNDLLNGRTAVRLYAEPQAANHVLHQPPIQIDLNAPNVLQDQVGDNIDIIPARAVPPQQYTMSRGLSTVQDVWREYKEGIGGNPSVESLEQQFGAKWRSKDSERKHFSRRLVIYKFIQSKIDSGLSENDVLTALERKRLGDKLSLDNLQKKIKSREIDI